MSIWLGSGPPPEGSVVPHERLVWVWGQGFPDWYFQYRKKDLGVFTISLNVMPPPLTMWEGYVREEITFAEPEGFDWIYLNSCEEKRIFHRQDDGLFHIPKGYGLAGPPPGEMLWNPVAR